jgi:hypothetical protein
MIVAGLILLSVGAADLVRQFVRPARRWIGLLAAAVVVAAIGAVADALLAALLALAIAAAWTWLMPSGLPARAAFWPAVGLAALCVGLVALLGARNDPGLVGAVWRLPSPVGTVPFDLAVLVAGTVAFLLESANVVVRSALGVEMPGPEPVTIKPVTIEPVSIEPVAPPATIESGTAEPGTASRDAVPLAVEPDLKGGRLIGPLERVIVFALMLMGAYALVAAVFAAKGIVRFPEISRDAGSGNRAEYFLVGSMVSWALALAGAFLVWWGAGIP